MPVIDQNARADHGLEPVIQRSYPLTMDTVAPDKKEPKVKDPVAIALGSRVRHLRTKKGQSQDELAEAAKVDRRFISSIETGAKNATLRALARIADALDVSLSELFRDVPGYGKPQTNRHYTRT